MGLEQNIAEDIKTALRSGDHFTVGVLRLLNAAFHNKAIEKRGKKLAEELTEDEVLEILNREMKKRREAGELYQKGNRPDLVAKEDKEMRVIQKYLPAPLSREEMEKTIDNIFIKLGGPQGLNFGNVMKEVMKELKGKADAKIISEIIKQKLG